MTNPKTTTLDSVVHVVMLVIILGLLSLYIQLEMKFKDVTQSCEHLPRAARDPVHLMNDCTDTSDNHRDCIHHDDSSTAMLPLTLKASLLSSEMPRYSRTVLTADKSASILISQSSFHLQHAAFETSGQMKMDEFGRTENKKSTDKEFEESATDVTPALDSSPVEVTHTKGHIQEHKLPGPQEDKVQMPDAPIFQVQPSSTAGQQLLTKRDVYSQHDSVDNGDYDHSVDAMTESILTIQKEVAEKEEVVFGLEATSFDRISLSILETSKGLNHLAKQISSVENIFGKTRLSSDSNHYELHEGSIVSTDNILNDDDVGDDMCQSGNCDSDASESHRRFHIQPVPAQTAPNARSLDTNNECRVAGVDVNDQLMKLATHKDIETLVNTGTSAWCGSAVGGGYTCHFQNLCYKTAERNFIFLKGDQSVIEKHPSAGHFDVENFFSVSLSTVPGHNALKFVPIFLPARGLRHFSTVAILQGKSFMLHRFKPDNIMHVLHDDILPLYHSLRSVGLILGYEKPNVTILFTDHSDAGDYFSLYKTLSVLPPASIDSYNLTADILCFADAHVGLSNATLWYQYGFFQKQGPLEGIAPDLLLNVLRAATYLATHLQHTCMFCSRGNYLVLLSRKDNRKILNEGELMMSVARATKLKVLSVSIETHSVEEIISMVTNSKGIIGMHGSLLSFLIFLPIDSIVIELFPYAVNPLNYTPFKTFCNLPGSRIVYQSWSNQDRLKSVPHPDWNPQMGGIHHLSADEQNAIIQQSEVPEHFCCEDPSWLYHIYQDTEVDVAEVTSLVTTALTDASSKLLVGLQWTSELVQDIPITPGPVQNLTCQSVKNNADSGHLSRNYLLVWKLPWNVDFLEYRHLEFQLVISKHGYDDAGIHVDLPSDTLFYSLEPTRQESHVVYNVWVRVTVNGHLSGPFVYVMCQQNL